MTLFIKINAITKTALHIGGNDQGIDGMFRRTANGDLVLPGTSIAGALRSHLTRIVPALTTLPDDTNICCALTDTVNPEEPCGCIVCQLMGDVSPVGSAAASRLMIDDVVISGESTRFRDGVGIDRAYGTSSRATRSKFDMEAIPVGTPLTIRMELDSEQSFDKQLLALLLDEWRNERIRIGGNGSRGLGVLTFEAKDVSECELNPTKDVSDLMKILRADDPAELSFQQYQEPQTNWDTYRGSYKAVEVHERDVSVQHWLQISYELNASGFFLTNDLSMANERNYNHYAMTHIPGASMRGAMRSQTERIARTIVNNTCSNEREFLDRCPASNPLATWDGQNGARPYLESTTSRIARSNSLHFLNNPQDKTSPSYEWFDLAEQLFGTTYFGSRLAVQDLVMVSAPIWKRLDFLAIDRFTGGGKDGAKFDAKALWQPKFRGTLTLEAPRDWEIGWLLYVLKDFIDGLVPVGFGAAKGFGEVMMQNVKFTFGAAHDELLPGLALAGNGFFKTCHRTWEEMVQGDWAEKWRNKIDNFHVPDPIAYEDDSDYYWSEIATLYPREGIL